MPISPDDQNFWLESVKDVTRQEKKAPVEQLNPSKAKITIHEKRQYAVKQEFSSYSKALEDAEFGGIDKATLKRFKKEEFPIEAVLDLHGKTENQAFDLVEDFIVQNYNLGRRCVIIITGKGLSVHENDDLFAAKGILKKQVPTWLNMARLRGMILVYKHPSARLGGSGALYILLRRQRKA
ncbi:MAG: Smr/MutS family protein [Alphaproteobacteria bacterium]|nr:Smr/MutS family protein [Alphaproteobacteria bacterium]